MMTKQNIMLMMNTVILILVSVGFLLVYQFVVPTDIDDKLFNQVVTLQDTQIVQNVPAEGMYQVVYTKQNAVNTRGEIVGVVYNVRASYNYFMPTDLGYLELLVGIDKDSNVSVQIVKFKQTESYTAGLQWYVYEYFQNMPIDGLVLVPVEDLEPEAGATARATTGKVKELVGLAIQHYLAQSASLSEVNLG